MIDIAISANSGSIAASSVNAITASAARFTPGRNSADLNPAPAVVVPASSIRVERRPAPSRIFPSLTDEVVPTKLIEHAPFNAYPKPHLATRPPFVEDTPAYACA